MSTELSLPVLDVEKLQPQNFNLVAAKETIAKAVEQAKAIELVLTQSDLDSASVAVVEARKVLKELEEHRKQMKAPALDYGKAVDDLFKKLGNDLAIQESRLADSIGRYQRRQKAILEEKAREEQQRLQEEADKAAEQNGTQTGLASVVVPEVVPKQQKLSDQNVAGLSSRRIKKWRVTDLSLVPVQYLVPNDAALTAKRREFDFDDQSTIPGIEFYVEEKV